MPRKSPLSRLSTEQTRRMLGALDRALDYAGGWTALAHLLTQHSPEPVTAQGVFRWATSGVPAHRAVDLETATGGVVLRQELRPDLYDNMRSDAA